jgi:F-type H+-transporting ATPase subunit b
MTDTTEHIQIDAASHAEGPQILGANTTMVFLTWVSFFLLLAVLYKFAWRPILSALDAREAAIRKSVEDADRIKEELAQIHASREKELNVAYAKAKDIIEESRRGAVEAAHIIQQKAKDEAQILLQNATRDIRDETEKARAQLKSESARLAVELTTKLIRENLDEEKSRRLINQYIKEL